MASYVAPEVREKFETLSINLKDYILERNVQINDIYDLINVLENLVSKKEYESSNFYYKKKSIKE